MAEATTSDTGATKATSTTKATAATTAATEEPVDDTAEYEAVKDVENENTFVEDPEAEDGQGENPMADAVDPVSGKPIVGVSADLYRPMPEE